MSHQPVHSPAVRSVLAVATWGARVVVVGVFGYSGIVLAATLLRPSLTPYEAYSLQRARVAACYQFLDTRDPSIVTDAERGAFGEIAYTNLQPLFGEAYAVHRFVTEDTDGRERRTVQFSTGSAAGFDTPYTACTVVPWELDLPAQEQLAGAVLQQVGADLPVLDTMEDERWTSASTGVSHWRGGLVLCAESDRPFRLLVRVEDGAVEEISMRDFPDGFDAPCQEAA